MLLENIERNGRTIDSVQSLSLLGHDTSVADAIAKDVFFCISDPLPEFEDVLERLSVWMTDHINIPDKTSRTWIL